MRAFALLVVGVVVGWVASGEWSLEAVGDESIVDAARASGSLTATTQANLANAEPSPQWNSVPANGPRRVWETQMEIDANGQQRPVTLSRLVNADGTIVPETPQGLVGRFQATAYGSPSGHGCYVVDTMSGKTWHVSPGIGRQLMSEALVQPAAQAATPVPTAAYGASTYSAPSLLGPQSQTGEPIPQSRPVDSPRSNVVPTPKPELAEPESNGDN